MHALHDDELNVMLDDATWNNKHLQANKTNLFN